MVEAAVADVDGLEASRIEIDAGGPSYTADTLAALLRGGPDARAVRDPRRRRGGGPAHVGALRRGAGPGHHRRRRAPGRRSRPRPPRAGAGPGSRCPASRCRAPTCAPERWTAARSTTSSPTRSPTGSRRTACTGRAVTAPTEEQARPVGGRHLQPARRGPSRRWMAVFSALLAAAVVAGRRPGLRRRADGADEPGRQERVDRHATRPQPGFEALLEPTPTLLVVHGSGSTLVSAAVLALNSGDVGGSVLLVPPATRWATPTRASRSAPCRPSAGRRRRSCRRCSRCSGVGITEVVVVDDARWAELVAPVAPLTIENPDDVGRVPRRARSR